MVKKLPKIISQEEFEKLFVAAEKKSKRASKKRKETIRQYMLAMLLGFEAGLRISEIVGWKDRVPKLTKQNIEGNSIRVVSGKGQKDRIVPRPKRMNNTAIDMLPFKISRRALQSFVTELGRKILDKEISFHCVDIVLLLHNQFNTLVG